jgi:hypothetical protein
MVSAARLHRVEGRQAVAGPRNRGQSAGSALESAAADGSGAIARQTQKKVVSPAIVQNRLGKAVASMRNVMANPAVASHRGHRLAAAERRC